MSKDKEEEFFPAKRDRIGITPTDLAVILYNFYEANNDPDIGNEDTEYTIDDFEHLTNVQLLVSTRLLEAFLWSSNMRSEKGEFWHPRGYSFKEFVNKVLTQTENYRFDHTYNWITKVDLGVRKTRR